MNLQSPAGDTRQDRFVAKLLKKALLTHMSVHSLHILTYIYLYVYIYIHMCVSSITPGKVSLTCPCTAAIAGAAFPSLRSCTGSQPAPEPPLSKIEETTVHVVHHIHLNPSFANLQKVNQESLLPPPAAYLSPRRAPPLDCPGHDKPWAQEAPGELLLLLLQLHSAQCKHKYKFHDVPHKHAVTFISLLCWL